MYLLNLICDSFGEPGNLIKKKLKNFIGSSFNSQIVQVKDSGAKQRLRL